jgi:hypothetical protein
MMSKTEFTASANVRLTVEVMNLGPYGEGWTADKIHEQTEREAVEELTRIIMAGQKEVPGCSRVCIVGQPEVVIVSQRKVKP